MAVSFIIRNFNCYCINAQEFQGRGSLVFLWAFVAYHTACVQPPRRGGKCLGGGLRKYCRQDEEIPLQNGPGQ